MSQISPVINTIEEVVDALDDIILLAEADESSIGYFAALYRKVTLKVKDGIAENQFQDGPRMEKLDVIFATRYIDAYYAYKNAEPVTESWQEAFNMTERFWPTVLQNLLIGMNAHINLDLGIASAKVMEGKDIQGLKGDFDKINEILSSLVNEVEEDLSKVWPTLKKILKLTKKVDGFLVDFAMKLARDGAWKFAISLSGLDATMLDKTIALRDSKIAKTGNLITSPGFIPSIIFKIIRIGEIGSVKEKIGDLRN